MARKKLIETDELIRFVDEYRLDNPGVEVKISKLAAYLQTKGVNAEAHNIRRNEEVKQYISAVNQETDDRVQHELAVYRTLDIDAFLAKNNSLPKLRKALSTRDGYYAQMAAMAADAFKKRKDAEEKMRELEARVSSLEEQLRSVQARADNAVIRKKDRIISKLQDILKSYVYPDAANALMQEAGVFEVISTLIDKAELEKRTLRADTEISKFDSVNSLMGGFDEQ